MIPGINLLNIALGAISPQQAKWRQFKARTQNSIGNFVVTYYADVTIIGSVQPMPADEVHEMGFDIKKVYAKMYTANPVIGVNRGESPDLIIYNGRKFEVVGSEDWYMVDGWNGLTLVDVGAA